MGAAGRDFHNFNCLFRNCPESEVVAFTAAQIPDIDDRTYPPELAGPLYPDGVPIVPEDDLESLIRERAVDEVWFSYSDVSHEYVMHKANRVIAWGAHFGLFSATRTMLETDRPVIAITAVRTGCGKSQTARWLSGLLRRRGLGVAVIRHPMPYGDLERQAVQRFASRADLDAADCTIEEREEYEPHLAAGNVVYAGVDYARILRRAEEACDVILWDGGNNDFPFMRPDLHIVLVDPLRPGHETTHHPGEAVLRMADVIVVAKTDAAAAPDVQRVTETARRINPRAALVRAASPVTLEDEAAVRGKRVLVIEDGPTTTHGGMSHGAGYVAALRAQPAAIVDPRSFVPPALAPVYRDYPHLGPVLPALGYNRRQLELLEQAIAAAPVDVVVSATPVDLAGLVRAGKRIVRARYEFAETAGDGLTAQVEAFLARSGLAEREE